MSNEGEETQEKTGSQAPKDFNACPVCGSTNRFLERILKEEQEAGRAGKEIKVALQIITAAVMDPRLPQLIGTQIPAGQAIIDSCDDCGAVYTVHTQRVKVPLSALNQPGGAKQSPMGQIPFGPPGRGS